jgi:hypothetical protein
MRAAAIAALGLVGGCAQLLGLADYATRGDATNTGDAPGSPLPTVRQGIEHAKSRGITSVWIEDVSGAGIVAWGRSLPSTWH